MSGLVGYLGRGLRIDVDRMGRFPFPVLLALGFSVSGGGVGGKTFLFMMGGALWSLGILLDKFRWTRFVAAKLIFSGGLSSFAPNSAAIACFRSTPTKPVPVFALLDVAINRALPR